MIVQHNIFALNANRQLNIVQKTGSKSVEKLSSGYQINRAADDAAGLSISEKMRKQIRGLTKAGENVEDGISLCQVADGAMAEMQDMTHRMNELCVQAANGTNSAADRTYIQMEIEDIVEEFGRIINTTKFNEVYIFRGDETYRTSPGSNSVYESTGGVGIGAVPGITAYAGKNFGDVLTEDIGDASWVKANCRYGPPFTIRDRSCAWIDFTNFKADTKKELISKLNGQGFDWSCCHCNLHGSIKFVPSVSTSALTTTDGSISYDYLQLATGSTPNPSRSNESIKIDIDDIWKKYQSGSDSLGEVICQTMIDVLNHAGDRTLHSNSCLTQDLVGFAYQKGTGKFYILDIDNMCTGPNIGSSEFSATPRSDTGELEPAKPVLRRPKVETITLKQLAIHAGADADGTNKVIMKLPTFTNGNLSLSVSALTEDLATNSIDVLSDILQTISSNRSRIGAYQNRLEHTSLNLDNIVENTTDSESQIRDTDMADEMVRYSNNSILAQAGQSMLSQANNNQQNILSLLTA